MAAKIKEEFAQKPQAGSLTEREFLEQGRIGSRPDRIALSKIKPRPHGDTRELDAGHVLELAESISALGLIEPIVIDIEGRLVAGGHRLEAMRLLMASPGAQIQRLEELAGKSLEREHERIEALVPGELDSKAIPVARLDFDANTDPDRAFRLEVAENEKRRDYSAAQVREWYDRLRELGYEEVKGRPRRGTKPIGPTLTAVIGRSYRTIRRLMDGESQKSANAEFSLEVLSAQGLGRAIRRYLEASKGSRKKRHRALREALDKIEPIVQTAAEE